MSPSAYAFISGDLPAMLALTLACLTCGLLGNFLVLRRESLMGDAISHSVLPGLVLAFLFAQSRATLPMFLGAAAAGILTVVLVDLLRRYGKVERSAAMGVVFSVMFALGVVLLRIAAAEGVDLDADCVLYGQPEMIRWHPPADWSSLFRWETLRGFTTPEGHALGGVPREVVGLAAIALLSIAALYVFRKELALTCFDPALAASLGFSPQWITRGLMVLIAAAAVVSFEAIGSILVIAMLICPGATARLYTDRLRTQILLSGVFALVTGIGGYVIGAFVPLWLGFADSLLVSGTATLVAGGMLGLSVLFAPSHGLIARARHRRRIAQRIAREDVVGMLYRAEELGRPEGLTRDAIARSMGSGSHARLGLKAAVAAGEVALAPDNIARLTPSGRDEARKIVRSHRLWELFLVRELDLRPDHVHATAERLEHLRADGQRLMPPRDGADRDPHEREIP